VVGGIIVTSAQTSPAIRFSSNNGVSYDSGAADYTTHVMYTFGSAGGLATGTTNQSTGYIVPAAIDAGSFATFDLVIEGFNKTTTGRGGRSIVTQGQGGALISGMASFTRNANVASDAFQIYAPAGTMTGNITVEGMRG